MSDFSDLLSLGKSVDFHVPWPRVIVAPEAWEEGGRLLAAGEVTLLGLWGEAGWAHMALLGGAGEVAVLSVACRDGGFPSIGRVHPPAIRLERAARDLYGITPVGLPDQRPWLRHAAEEYAFLPVEGEDLHEIPVGPVHAGVIEPGHFRFSAVGETVLHLDARLFYTHRGVERLAEGRTFERALAIVEGGHGCSICRCRPSMAGARACVNRRPGPPASRSRRAPPSWRWHRRRVRTERPR